MSSAEFFTQHAKYQLTPENVMVYVYTNASTKCRLYRASIIPGMNNKLLSVRSKSSNNCSFASRDSLPSLQSNPRHPVKQKKKQEKSISSAY